MQARGVGWSSIRLMLSTKCERVVHIENAILVPGNMKI